MTVKGPIITQRDEQVLQLLYTFKYLSLPLLVQGLGYKETSINHVGELAKKLTDKDLAYRFPLPSTTKGTKSYIYTLSRRGLSYLRSVGLAEADTGDPTAIAPSYMHFAHTLATNELLIAATRLPGLLPTIHIDRIATDWQLRKSPLHLPDRDGHTLRPVIADALVTLYFTSGARRLQTTIWMEVDLGSEGIKQVRQKCHTLYSIVSNPAHLTTIGARVLTVAFATTHGEKRRSDLQAWIEQELQALGKTHDADLFLTTSFTPGHVDPLTIYTEPVWMIPVSHEQVPLIDLSQ